MLVRDGYGNAEKATGRIYRQSQQWLLRVQGRGVGGERMRRLCFISYDFVLFFESYAVENVCILYLKKFFLTGIYEPKGP